MIKEATLRFIFKNTDARRRRPYPPSFKRTPAKIIDPATGASTWALGSQRWVRNKGVFTRKAVIVINHQSVQRLGEDLRKNQNGRVKSM